MGSIDDVPLDLRRAAEESLSADEEWAVLPEEERERRVIERASVIQATQEKVRRERVSVARTQAARETAAGGSPPLEGRHCREHEGPPCWPLLNSRQTTIMSQGDRWPGHLCESVRHESLRRWATSNIKTLTPEQLALVMMRAPFPAGNKSLITIHTPLPVGKKSLMERAAHYDEAMITACAHAYPYMPFEQDENAALIFSARFPAATATFFGLVRWNASEGRYVASEPKFSIVGADTTHRDVQRFQQNACRWWLSIAGPPTNNVPRGGRPKALGTEGELLTAFLAYRDEVSNDSDWGRPVVKQDFADYLGVHVDTLNNTLRRFGMSWKQLRKIE